MNCNRKSIHPALLPARTPEEAALLLFAMPAAKGGRLIVTLNFELLARAATSRPFTRLIRAADGRVCDGIGGRLLLKIGHRQAEIPRIPGIDLGYALLRLAHRHGMPVFLLGGKVGIAERAAKKLERSLPNLQIAGTAHGYFTKVDLPALRGRIRASGAKLVIVCLGSPKQEEWIAENRRYLPGVRLFLPLGGSLDVWAGEVPRAPLFWQKAGLEWLWRIAHSPKRLIRLWNAGVNLLQKPLRTDDFFQKSEILFQIE